MFGKNSTPTPGMYSPTYDLTRLIIYGSSTSWSMLILQTKSADFCPHERLKHTLHICLNSVQTCVSLWNSSPFWNYIFCF